MRITAFIKRVVDIVASLLLLLFFFILLLTMFAIFILEGKPISYNSKRHISAGKEVVVTKFRMMVRDAKSPKYNLHGRFMQDGYLDIHVSCEVYTDIERFLEKSQHVEILQLLNIIFHGMSLIGNRPLPYENLQYLQKFPGWEERF